MMARVDVTVMSKARGQPFFFSVRQATSSKLRCVTAKVPVSSILLVRDCSTRRNLKLPWPTLRMALILTISLAFNTASAAVNYQRLYSFGSADQLGMNPQSALIEATNGLLYGTT